MNRLFGLIGSFIWNSVRFRGAREISREDFDVQGEFLKNFLVLGGRNRLDTTVRS